MHILITGAAGFIGSAVALRVLERGDSVLGIDNLNPYYDVSLKRARLQRLRRFPAFRFVERDIGEREAMHGLFSAEGFDAVVNLAAQVGVRYSVENPHAFADANLTGFCNILEGARSSRVKHLVFASSSSVYGANSKLPFSENDSVDHPISLYAATKKANELMAHSYAHLFAIPTTGLRFFTVYGPWGRPDMALFRFTKNILEGRPIEVFNNGRQTRDFTYIDDIVDGVVRVLDRPAPPLDSASRAPYRIYNIGNDRAVELMHFIEVLQRALGTKARMKMLPRQPGDVDSTRADVSALQAAVGYRPSTPVEVGVPKFVEWYKAFYGVAGKGRVPVHGGQAA
jgi:UDP-glucuronate 4-epimerase